MMTLLGSAQGGQTIHQLNINEMRKLEYSIVFMLSKPISNSQDWDAVTVELNSYTVLPQRVST